MTLCFDKSQKIHMKILKKLVNVTLNLIFEFVIENFFLLSYVVENMF